MVVIREGTGSLSQRLYEALSSAILSGSYEAGAPLPSSRALAAQLGISRNTVNSVYERLEAEGFVAIKASAGVFAAQGAYAPKKPPSRSRDSDYVGFRKKRNDIADFKSGLPDGRHFPVAAWSRALAAALKKASPLVFGYGEPEGRPELREAIASYVGRYRAARCAPNQILVTAGTTQAIGILGSVLLSGKLRDAVVEDPLTQDIKSILQDRGARIMAVPVGETGLDPSLIPGKLKPALVYVTPSHQYPTGRSMPIQNRIALTEYARRVGSVVIEDDYDSEFRFDGPPLPSLQGLDPDNVIYIGTFSKTLSPALRCGYLILPARLIRAAREAKWLSDLHNPILDQLALADFIKSGRYARHIAKMKRLYRARRACLAEALTRTCEAKGVEFEIIGCAAGLHLVVRFPGRRFGAAELESLESSGAKAYPVSVHSLKPKAWEDSLILGYGSLDEAEIETGVKSLVKGIASIETI
jgi:GntR family transcriptional regulator / MocR family aminotransferase